MNALRVAFRSAGHAAVRPRGAGAVQRWLFDAGGRGDGHGAGGAELMPRCFSTTDETPPESGDQARGHWRSWIDQKLSEIDSQSGGKEGAGEEGAAKPAAAEGTVAAEVAAADAAPTPQPPPSPITFTFPKPQAVEERPDRLSGYALLGSAREPSARQKRAALEAAAPAEGAEGEEAAEDVPVAPESESPPEDLPPRINPYRLFYPGQTYNPGELDPYSEGGSSMMPSMSTRGKKPAMLNEAAENVDWKNVQVLTNFVSETGKLIPRRYTKLQAKMQRRVVKKVKLARHMALMPPTGRLPQFARKRNPYTGS